MSPRCPSCSRSCRSVTCGRRSPATSSSTRSRRSRRTSGRPRASSSYQELGELSPRRRTLVKMLGNFDTYVVTPRSVRRALSHAVDLSEYARELYVEGSLVFVGFRYGDPDLSALLDRVFGMFEPPRGTHYFLGAGMGPVTVDELMADHHIEVVNLAGRGGDEVAERSVLEWLEEARDRVHRPRRLARADAAGRRRRRGLDRAARRRRRRGRRGPRRARADRAQGARRQEVGHRRRGLARQDRDAGGGRARADARASSRAMYEPSTSAICAARSRPRRRRVRSRPTTTPPRSSPRSSRPRPAAGRSSSPKRRRSRPRPTDPQLASTWWARLGGWYATKLDRMDYAMPSLRRAHRARPAESHRVHRARRRVSQAAEVGRSGRHAARARRDRRRRSRRSRRLLLELGRSRRDPARVAREGDRGLRGRRRDAAHRRGDELDSARRARAAVSPRRALGRSREGPRSPRRARDRSATRAAAIRHELATLRAEKLGDLEGAIARYEAAVAANGSDAGARCKALVELYDKTGRTEDYLRTMERLGQVAPEGEKLATLRKLAAELEDRDATRAIEAYEKLLAADPTRRRRVSAGSSACCAAESKWRRARRRRSPSRRGREDAGAARRAPPRGRAVVRARARRHAGAIDDAITALREVLAIDDARQDRARGAAAAVRRGRAVRPRGRRARRIARPARSTPTRPRRSTPRPARSRPTSSPISSSRCVTSTRRSRSTPRTSPRSARSASCTRGARAGRPRSTMMLRAEAASTQPRRADRAVVGGRRS